MVKKKAPPRQVPDRDEKYMGLAWMHASFSKDPFTQVGAQIVGQYNQPLGSGYNGPPRLVHDDEISWDRSTDEKEVTRYDIIVHAEVNAIDHSCGDLTESTLYVTALPCPSCMLEIVRKEMGKVIYFDFQGDADSSLRNALWREKSLNIAKLANVKVQRFTGDINWVADWTERLRQLGIFEMPD
jgi:deoxycytidylate deaminase